MAVRASGSGAGGVISAAEQSSTPVTDDTNVALGTAGTFFARSFTLPTTHKFYKITALEWKNGTNVVGNVKASAWIVDANPPVSVNIMRVAECPTTAASGANSVQKVSVNQGIVLAGGTRVCGAVVCSNAAHDLRTFTDAAFVNAKLIPITTDLTAFNTTAWDTSTTQSIYMKVYYQGYD